VGGAAAGTETDNYSYSGYTNGNCYEFNYKDAYFSGEMGMNGITDTSAPENDIKNVITSATFYTPTPIQITTTQTPTITSVSPNSDIFDYNPADKTQDETITISGSGFTPSNNEIVFIKGSILQSIPNQIGKVEASSIEGGAYGPAIYIPYISSNGTSISSLINNSQTANTGYLDTCGGGGGAGDGWRCPNVSLVAGSYEVYVKNANGDVSNGLPFTVTSGTATTNTTINATLNTAFPNPTVTNGQANSKIGSYVIAAPVTEGIKISSVVLTAGSGNVYISEIMNNGNQLGTSVGSPTSIYTFPVSLILPAGSQITLDVYGEVTTPQYGAISPATTLSGITATGVSSGSVYQLSTPVTGQQVTTVRCAGGCG
jgi:hypothetical protein